MRQDWQAVLRRFLVPSLALPRRLAGRSSPESRSFWRFAGRASGATGRSSPGGTASDVTEAGLGMTWKGPPDPWTGGRSRSSSWTGPHHAGRPRAAADRRPRRSSEELGGRSQSRQSPILAARSLSRPTVIGRAAVPAKLNSLHGLDPPQMPRRCGCQHWFRLVSPLLLLRSSWPLRSGNSLSPRACVEDD